MAGSVCLHFFLITMQPDALKLLMLLKSIYCRLTMMAFTAIFFISSWPSSQSATSTFQVPVKGQFR